MAKRDIVVIGASAGGVIALKGLISSLPATFSASIFIVQHIPAFTTSMLPEILTYRGSLRAVHPADGDVFQPGAVYVAPPDHHLLLEGNRMLVKKGPKENRFRPSIDALFRSAAYSFGERVIGIVLTGLLDDGTSGMWSIKRLGGMAIVQEPDDAQYPSMPSSVIEYVDVDHVVPLANMAALLTRLTEEEPAPPTPVLSSLETDILKTEVQVAAQKNAFEMGILEMGDLSPLTCPECSGVLVRFREGKLIRYRCHTGHAYTANALLSEIDKSVEDNLWKAVRVMEEAIMLLEESGKASAEGGDQPGAERFFSKARENRERTNRLHNFIFQQNPLLDQNGLPD